MFVESEPWRGAVFGFVPPASGGMITGERMSGPGNRALPQNNGGSMLRSTTAERSTTTVPSFVQISDKALRSCPPEPHAPAPTHG